MKRDEVIKAAQEYRTSRYGKFISNDYNIIHWMADFALESRKSLLAGLREKVEKARSYSGNGAISEGYAIIKADVLALLDEQD